MWAHALSGPGRLAAVEVDRPGDDTLHDGFVVLRLRAAAICGSDLPSFLGRTNPLVIHHGAPGYPLHEIVGDVVASRADLAVGTRVVGWSHDMAGLAEYVLAPAASLLALDGPGDDALDDVDATMIQPLCTVLYTLDRLPDPRGRRVAVIGQGSLGILFSHVLAARGAARVTGVDMVDRRDVAAAFGVDDPVWGTSSTWARELPVEERPELVVEAVGHQVGTVNDALAAVAHHGTVFAFGVPDDPYYPIAFETLFRRGATLLGGTAGDRRASLARARTYLHEHPDLPGDYLTHVFGVADAQRAFECAARPAAGRLKVGLTTDPARARHPR